MAWQSLWKLYQKSSTIFIIGVGLLTFGIAEYYVDIKPPRFGQKLENLLTSNQKLMQSIGDWDTAEFNYTDDKKINNTFYLIIKGKCNNSFVKLSGIYNKNKYVILDSVVTKCK